jgi:HK97 gp10 family phage protein
MAMRVSFKVKGLEEAIQSIADWSEEKVQAVKDAVNESALNIQTAAKQNLTSNGNVDNGRLRSSIQIEPASSDHMKLTVGTNVFYAPYVEWGTGVYATHPTIPGRQTPWAFPVAAASDKKHYNWRVIEIDGQPYYLTKGAKPHPFLFPAAEAEKNNYVRNIGEALRK